MTDNRFYRPTKGSSIERRIFMNVSFDLREQIKQAFGIDEIALDHFFYVPLIRVMPALDFRQRLPIKVIMQKRKSSHLSNELTALLPCRQFRNEIIGGSQLNVDLEPLLQNCKLP